MAGKASSGESGEYGSTEDPRASLARATDATAAGVPGQERLRILIANSNEALLDRVEKVVTALGHVVASRETDIARVGTRTVELDPDVALVALGRQDMEAEENATYALDLISEIVHEARCPVIAVLESENPDFIARAASRGISAYASPIRTDEVLGAVEVALERFLEHRSLEDAFKRRAVIERAKGILMQREQIDEREAFERLRSHARRTSQRLVDLADAVQRGHLVLNERTEGRSAARGRAGPEERSG